MANQPMTLTQLSTFSESQLSVLRNTYLLLSMTLLFSGLVAAFAMVTHAPALPWFIQLIGMFGLLFALSKFRNSGAGLVLIFAFTGFMGYTLGPILNYYLLAFQNGGELILTALGGTGVIFLGLSAYALASRKDFSFMGAFLIAGMLVAVIASIANIFLHIAGLQLAISAAVVFIASGLILYDTSRIIHGGETNYIMATASLYINILNLFISLLQLLSAFSGNRD